MTMLDVLWRLVLLYFMAELVIKHILQEGRLILGAPVEFCIVLLVAMAVAYLASAKLHRATIEAHRATNDGLTERLRGRDEQIAELKAKVGTDLPSEIKERIDQLESQLRQLEPCRLGDEYVARLTEALRVVQGSVVVAQDMAVAEARTIAIELSRAFSNAGWSVSSPMIMGPGNPPPSGIGIGVEDPASLTSKQIVIVNALSAIHLAFDLQRNRSMPHFAGGLPAPIPDAEILISQKVI
jgi:hypothetical protein